MALLARKKEQIFHVRDLGILWEIKDKNTLRVTLKRYCDAGLLYRIYRGLYAISPLGELDPVLVGAKSLSRFCYLTAETVLYESGLIAQPPEASTFASEISRRFSIGSSRYISRKLAARFLYHPAGVEIGSDGIFRASQVRALADILYFNPFFHVDRDVDWKSLRSLQQQIGYPLTPLRYVSSKTT